MGSYFFENGVVNDLRHLLFFMDGMHVAMGFSVFWDTRYNVYVLITQQNQQTRPNPHIEVIKVDANKHSSGSQSILLDPLDVVCCEQLLCHMSLRPCSFPCLLIPLINSDETA